MTRFMWLRTHPNGDCCENGHESSSSIKGGEYLKFLKITPWPSVRKRTTPTERPPLVGVI
jgi:hypothetical protein